ncbi:UNVERIFIED_CONTAM: hypothetical protein GTU68_028095, partial [Idotea baltica]|nr:hypothetical protein [Idotea baltica]
GEVWHLHQLVLSASSGHFAQLLRLTPPGQTPILILDGPPASDVHALIHFIYHGEVNVDQESLPSLLRTAASLRIKGLADVTGLTQDGAAGAATPVETAEIAAAVTGLAACGLIPSAVEEVSPLNLSCHKEEFKEEEEEREGLPPREGEVKGRKEASEVFFHPPSKRVRTHEPPSQPPPAPAHPAPVAVITPPDSQTATPDPVYTPPVSSNPAEALMLEKEPLPPQPAPLDAIRVLPSKCSSTFFNVPISNTSFPVLNMALSPHIAYQQSSTSPQASLDAARPDRNVAAPPQMPVSTICEPPPPSDLYNSVRISVQSPSRHETARPQPVQEVASTIYDAQILSNNAPVDICSSNTNEYEEASKAEERLLNPGCGSPSSTEVEESSPVVEVIPEKTFNHKKFSPCTIPNSTTPSKKTVHIVRGVYTPHPITTSTTPTIPYKIKSEALPDPVPVTNEIPVTNYSPEIIIQSPSIVKLTPVAVASYTSNLNSTFPTNSIIYTASSAPTFNKPSENTLPSTTSANLSTQSNNVVATAVVESAPTTPQEMVESPEISCSTSSTSSSSYPTSSVVTTTEGTTQNAQRVTINMRTFKVRPFQWV